MIGDPYTILTLMALSMNELLTIQKSMVVPWLDAVQVISSVTQMVASTYAWPALQGLRATVEAASNGPRYRAFSHRHRQIAKQTPIGILEPGVLVLESDPAVPVHRSHRDSAWHNSIEPGSDSPVRGDASARRARPRSRAMVGPDGDHNSRGGPSQPVAWLEDGFPPFATCPLLRLLHQSLWNFSFLPDKDVAIIVLEHPLSGSVGGGVGGHQPPSVAGPASRRGVLPASAKVHRRVTVQRCWAIVAVDVLRRMQTVPEGALLLCSPCLGCRPKC